MESTFLVFIHFYLYVTQCYSNGFQFQSDVQIREGIGDNYVGDNIYSTDYSHALDTKDYSDPIDYVVPAKSSWEEAAEKNNYPMSDYSRDIKPFFDPQNENIGEELAIQDCDKEIQLSDGSWFYFVYKDLNATKCMCHYSDYKHPEMMPGYDCSIIASSRGKRHLLTAPDQDYKNAYSCKDKLHVKGSQSTQVFLYKKLTWENWHFKRTCYCFYGKDIDPTITIKRICDKCKHWRGLPRPQKPGFRRYKWCPWDGNRK